MVKLLDVAIKRSILYPKMVQKWLNSFPKYYTYSLIFEVINLYYLILLIWSDRYNFLRYDLIYKEMIS